MDAYEQAAVEIIKEQENIIGPLALEQASRIQGINIGNDKRTVKVEGNKAEKLELLVQQYKKIFGQTSVEVCREAAAPFLTKLSPQEIPISLK